MKTILVIGDAMLDIYTFGHIHRISPEAPVPEFLKNGKEIYKLGGAANTAANIGSMGAEVTLVCGLGKDNASGKFTQEIGDFGLALHAINIPCTTVKQRYVDEKFNQHVLRVAREEVVFRIDDKQFREILQKVDPPETVVISDYDKGILNRERITIIKEIFAGIPIIVDPKIANFLFYEGVSVIMPNHIEAAKALSVSEKQVLSSYALHAQTIRNALRCEVALITLGKLGVVMASDSFAGLIPTIEREVFDVTGAGDLFCAVVAFLWNDYNDKKKIMGIANHIAGKGVEHLGNYIASEQDITETQGIF